MACRGRESEPRARRRGFARRHARASFLQDAGPGGASLGAVMLLCVCLGTCLAALSPPPPPLQGGGVVQREAPRGACARAWVRGAAGMAGAGKAGAGMAGARGLAAHTPLLALRGGGSKLAQQVKKKAKKPATEAALSSEADSGSFWAGEQRSRRADTKSFQAKARALIEREDGPLQEEEDSDDEGGPQVEQVDDFDLNKYVTEGSLDAVWGKEGPKTLSEADSVGCACSLCSQPCK